MALVADLIGKLRRKEQESSTRAEAAYADLLARAVAGEEVDPDEAAGVIDAAGRTAERFADEVGHRLTRIGLQKKADELPAADAEVRRLQAEFDQIGVDWNAEMDAMNKRYFAKREKVRARQDAAAAWKQGCEDAARDLARMVPDDDPRKVRLRAIGAAVADLEGRLRLQHEAAFKARCYLDRNPADEKVVGRDYNRRASEQTLADADRVIAELRDRAAALAAERADLEAGLRRA